MTQNVLQIPTAAPLSGMALVTDVNNALAGMASLSSGGTAPTASSLGLASLAGVLWHDTAANQLKLRNQADSAWISLGTVNETSGIFVPAAAQTYSLASASATLALSNAGQFLLASSAITLTLPASSGLTTSWSVSVFAKGGPVTLALANNADALNGGVNASLIIPKGYFAELTCDAAGNYYALVIPASLGIATLASAATTDLGTASSQVVSISGTTTITGLGSSAPAGVVYTVQFAATLTLTYNAASLILPGAANIITAANDCAQFLSLGSGNWICIDYQKANGQPVAGASGSAPSVRQTALVGVANSSGQANFITTGSSLTPGLSATATPLLMTFAAGYGTSGAIDYVERLTADSASFFPALAANSQSYLYANRVSAGNVTGGATLAPPQIGAVYNQAAQSSLTFNQSGGAFTDDFGNAWTLVGSLTSTSGTIGLGSNNYCSFNGSTQYAYCSAIKSLQGSGNGGFSIAAQFKPGSVSSGQLFSLVNSAGYGLNVQIQSGKVAVYLSSNGTTQDIASGTLGSITIVAGTTYFIEFVYDPVAGKYYVYINGALDQTIASATKVVAGVAFSVGTQWNGTSGVVWYFGAISGLEILPYCRRPAGTAYTIPTTLPSISAAGYASDWFDSVNMVMKSPSVASSASGSNPTFASVNKLYLGEAITAAAAVIGITIYSFMQSGKNGVALPNLLGFCQGYQNVTSSRSAGTVYYNTTSRPILVVAGSGFSSGYACFYAYVNGNMAAYLYSTLGSVSPVVSFIVPPGASYQIVINVGSATISPWCELR